MLVSQGLNSRGLVVVFGAYALSDVVLALIMALSVRGVAGFGSLLVCRQLRAELSVRFCAAQPFSDDLHGGGTDLCRQSHMSISRSVLRQIESLTAQLASVS